MSSRVKKFIQQAVLILILVFGGGWFVGGVLDLGSLLVPPLLNVIKCPAGATAIQSYVQMSYDQPGQTSLVIHCQGQDGHLVDLLPDPVSNAIQYQIFYPAGVVTVLLLIGVWLVISRRDQRTSPYPS